MEEPEHSEAPAPDDGAAVVEEPSADEVVAVDDVVATDLPAVEAMADRASIVDGVEHSVDPRSVTVARLAGISTALGASLLPFTGVTVVWALGRIPSRVYVPLFTVWLVVFVFLAVITYKWPELHHRHLSYRVDESGVRIRQGVLWRKVISIPTSRVQHTDVSQGPLQRRYDIATVTVHTAGTEGASIALSGLEHGVARRLRDHLLPDHQNHAG